MYSFSIAAGTSNRNLGDFKQHKLVIHCCKGYKSSTGLLGCNQGVGRAAFLSRDAGSRAESIPLPFQLLDPTTLLDPWPLPLPSAPARGVSLRPFFYPDSPISLRPRPEGSLTLKTLVIRLSTSGLIQDNLSISEPLT